MAAIGAALLAFNVVTMIQGVIDAFTTWRAATQGMTLAQAALNLVMSLNPIALVVAANRRISCGIRGFVE